MTKILRNTSILMIGDFVTRALSILYLIPLLRIDPLIGTLNAALLIPFGFIITLGTMGINIILTNEMVKHKNSPDKLKSSIFSNMIILGVMALVSFIIIVFGAEFIVDIVAGNSIEEKYIEALVSCTKMLGIGVVIYSINTFFRAFFIAKEDFHIVSLTYISEQILKIILLFVGLFICHNKNILVTDAYLYVLSLSIIISLVSTLFIFICFFIKKRYLKVFKYGKCCLEYEYFKYLIIASIVIFASGSFAALFDLIDMSIINSIDVDNSQAIYNEYFTASMKLVLIPISMATGFISVMITHIGNTENGNKVNEFDKMINVSLLYSFLCVVILFGINEVFYEFMYGYESLGIFKIQVFIIPIYIARNMVGTYVLTNNGKNSSIIIALCASVFFKITLDILLYKLMGINGFVFSSIISITISIIILVMSNKELFLLTKSNGKQKLKYCIYFLILLILAFILSETILYLTEFSLINIGITALILLLGYICLYFKEFKKLGGK